MTSHFNRCADLSLYSLSFSVQGELQISLSKPTTQTATPLPTPLTTSHFNQCAYLSLHYFFPFPFLFRGSLKCPCQLLLPCPWCPPPPCPSSSPSLPLLRSPAALLRHNRGIPRIRGWVEWSESPLLEGWWFGNSFFYILSS